VQKESPSKAKKVQRAPPTRSREQDDEDKEQKKEQIQMANKQKKDKEILLRLNLFKHSTVKPHLAKCGGTCGDNKSGREFRLKDLKNQAFTRYCMANPREAIVTQLEKGTYLGMKKFSQDYDLGKYVEHPTREELGFTGITFTPKLTWEPVNEKVKEDERMFMCSDCARSQEDQTDSEKDTMEVQKNSAGPQHEMRSVHDLRLGVHEMMANSLLQESTPEHLAMKQAIFENVALSEAEEVFFELSEGQWCTTDPDVKPIPEPSLINIADRDICVITGNKAVVNTSMVNAALYTITGRQYLLQQQANLMLLNSINNEPMSSSEDDEGELGCCIYLFMHYKNRLTRLLFFTSCALQKTTAWMTKTTVSALDVLYAEL
jgi:hypothetical protein